MNVTTKRLAALTAGAALLLTMIWYLALFRPQSHAAHVAQTKYASAQQQITDLEGKVALLQQWEREKPQDQAQLAALNTMVPQDPDLHGILEQLHHVAVGADAQLTVLSPQNAYTSPSNTQGGGAAKSVQMTMNVAGNYAELSAFIAGLEQMPRSLVVDNVSIASSSTGLQASLTARVFYAS